MQLEGTVTLNKRAMLLDLRQDGGDAHFVFCLLPPTPPVSVLAGFMCGATIIGPDVQPSVTRIAIVRLPGSSARLRTAEAYLPPQGSVAEDLAALGLRVADPAAVDRHLAELLAPGDQSGPDQIPAAAFRAVVELFDRTWLAGSAASSGDP